MATKQWSQRDAQLGRVRNRCVHHICWSNHMQCRSGLSLMVGLSSAN